jgi:uncharacterized membrane-anchored protein YhcB (DUF1043 family)
LVSDEGQLHGSSCILEESSSEFSQPGSPRGVGAALISSQLHQRQQQRDAWGSDTAATGRLGTAGVVGAPGTAAVGLQKARVQQQLEHGQQLIELNSRVQSMQEHFGDSDAILTQLRSEKQQLQQHINEVAAEKAKTEAEAKELARQNEQLQNTLQDTLQRSAASAAGGADPSSIASSKTEKKLVKYSKQLQKEKTRWAHQWVCNHTTQVDPRDEETFTLLRYGIPAVTSILTNVTFYVCATAFRVQ